MGGWFLFHHSFGGSLGTMTLVSISMPRRRNGNTHCSISRALIIVIPFWLNSGSHSSQSVAMSMATRVKRNQVFIRLNAPPHKLRIEPVQINQTT